VSAEARRDATRLVLGTAGLTLGLALGGIVALRDLAEHPRAYVGLFAVASVAYGAAVARVLRHPPDRPAVLAALMGAAVAYRLLVLPTEPTLSTDVYRYVWDGRVAAAGISPYAYPATAPELHGLRDAHVFPRLNHAEWHTIYPPGAQLLFTGLARLGVESAQGIKAVLVAFDLLALGCLLGWLRALRRPLAWSLVYAWHPLVIVEVAGSGHLDAVVLATSVAALWAASVGRSGWAGALVGVGTLIKLYPLLLLAAVTPRRPARTLGACAAVLVVGYALHVGDGASALGSLGRYLHVEDTNGVLRTVLAALLTPLGAPGRELARGLPLLALGGVLVAVGASARGRGAPVSRRAVWVTGAYLLAVPNLFPWYAMWIVPVLAVAPVWPWLYLTCAVTLVYVVLAEPILRIPAWVTATEFVPLALGLLIAAVRGGGADARLRAPDRAGC
jgi:alpha-1,6-mannosyltransferase